MDLIAENFNNREIATAIWAAGLFGFVALVPNLRKGLFGVLRALLQWKLLVLFGSLAVYIAILCWLLSTGGLWSADQLGATAIWFVFSGAVILGRSLSVDEGGQYFLKLLKDSLSAAVVFEFVVVAFTFSLLIELLFVPVMALLGGMLALSESRAEYRPVQRFLELLLAGFVLVLLWYSASQIWVDSKDFFSAKTARNFILPIVMMVGCMPVFYGWYCYSAMENASKQIDFKTFQTAELKRYARWRFFLIFGWRPRLLKRAARQFQLLPAKTTQDVDRIVEEILDYERLAKDPPVVDPERGWSPFLAREFLAEEGLRTGDYHTDGLDDEWWAISNVVDLDAQLLPNTVTYSIEGGPGVAKKLKLKGYFLDEFDPTGAILKFRQIARSLSMIALGVEQDEVDAFVPKDMMVDGKLGGTRVKSWSERFPTEKGFEHFFVLSREVKAGNRSSLPVG